MLTRTRLSLPALAIVLAACQSPAGLAEPASVAPPADAASVSVASEAETAWQTRELTDVRTGDRFAIADLAGKVVVIEPMAIWCTNCARQQREASKALGRLASEDIVYVSLDVDPSERAADLATYADERGFDWRFVVADRAMSRALAQAFGDQVLAPPSTPKIIVAPDGRVDGPNFGIQDARAIEAELRELLP